MRKLPMSTPARKVKPGATPEPPAPPPTIADAVLAALGRPPGLFRVNVVPLWQGCYRVNVLTGADPTSVSIPHSYFVEAGENGAVVAATPPIVRLYP
jgi:hypothetical protein